MGQIAGAAIGAAGDIAATAIQTAASLKNTIMTNKANRNIAESTNKANFQIAQMNNEYNERQLDKQIQTQWDMWNAENKYNDPSAQMERFRNAGINPYNAVGQISSGNASSMTPPTANTADTSGTQLMGTPMQTADFSSLQGLRGVARNFIDLINSQEETKGKQLDNQSKEIENTYKADMFKVEMYKKMLDSGLTKRQIKSFDIENQFKPEMMSSELQIRNTQNMYTRLQAQGQMIANLSSLQWYRALPTQIQQAITEKAVDINNKRLSGRYTEKQIETEVGKAMNEQVQYLRGFQNLEIGVEHLRKAKWDVIHSMYNSGPDGGLGLFNIGQGFYDQFRGANRKYDDPYSPY